MDASHPTLATTMSGWIPTRMDKPIETTGSRIRLSIVGSFGYLEIAIKKQYATVNGESFIDFFK
ncbi:MAG: hypothetical protein KAH18_11465 [Psychromonas sp.]|nr:hypothetical protein [Psychromonas sp.]